MGFLLPDDPDVTQLAYYLVAIPDAPEYRQAIKGHYGELGNAKLWGAEKVTQASYVAARAWLRAINETWRLIDMGWPDLLLSYIDDIETLLQAMQASGSAGCCPEGTTYYPPADFDFDAVPQPIVDAGFATSTSDLAGYADYRCMAAHMLLSNIQDKLDKLGPIILGGFALFNIVTGLLGGVLIFGGGGATLVVAGLAVDIMAVLGVISALDDVTAEMVTGWADTLEGDRETIVCAMQGADGAAAVKAALVAAVTDSIGAVGGTLVSFFNLDHLINAWWYGESNGVDLVQQIANAGHDPAQWDCPCEADVAVEFTFDTDAQGWEIAGAASWYDTWDCLDHGNGTPDGQINCDIADINAAATTGEIVNGRTYRFRLVQYREGHRPNNTPNPGTTYNVSLWQTGSGLNPVLHGSQSTVATETAPADGELVELDVSAWPDVVAGTGTQIVLRMGGGSGNGRACIDNVRIELDDVT